MLSVNFTEIEGVELKEVLHSGDARGQFIKFTPNNTLQQSLGSVAVSINPKAGTIRGIHLQVEPFAEEKIISCVQGSTFEVIIDIRPNSESFGKIATFELSQKNGLQVYLPKGIAHGFQTLLPDTIVHYCLTSEYSSEYSYSICPLGDIGIAWPIKEIFISDKDKNGVSLSYVAEKFAESLKG